MSLFWPFVKKKRTGARTFYGDIPVEVQYDWGKGYSSFAETAIAKNIENGETILSARLNRVTPGKANGEFQAVVDVEAFKSDKKIFSAEATFGITYGEQSRLMKTVMNRSFISEYLYASQYDGIFRARPSGEPGYSYAFEYLYASEYDAIANVITRDVHSNKVLSRSLNAVIDIERSRKCEATRPNMYIVISENSSAAPRPTWNNEKECIARRSTDTYSTRPGTGNVLLGDRLLTSRLPVASETAVVMLVESCFDPQQREIYRSTCWRNEGTGLLIDESIEHGQLPVDYHHYELACLRWPID